jgi:HlyD family secretion protein
LTSILVCRLRCNATDKQNNCKMKKGKWLIILIVMLIAAAALWYWKYRRAEDPVVLQTEQPRYGEITNSITATGTIQPVDTVSVGTQVSGTIKTVYADFNSVVKKGQLLAQLDKVLLQAQVQQYTGLLQQAKSQFVYAQTNFNRQKQLLDVGAISHADYETALYQYNAARDNVVAVDAQLKSAERNLSFADIYSPIDGTVLSRNVNEGQTVASSFNTPTLFVIAKDLKRMQVQAAVDEADIGNVKTGQKVTFSVDAFPDDVFEGTVEEVRLQPSVAANVVTYVTIINTANDQQKLKPGMTASITIYTRDVQNTLLVSVKATRFTPDSSLLKHYKLKGRMNKVSRTADKAEHNNKLRSDSTHQRSAGNTNAEINDQVKTKHETVWIKQGDTLVQKGVTVGLVSDADVQVLHGLTPADTVVTAASKGDETEAGSDNTVRSPFMPARRGGSGSGSGGGRRP